MEDNKGMGFLAVLQTILIVVKLNGVGAIAAWSWWLVLTPLWVGLAALLFLVFVYLVIK
jgi:hypothetical protein